MKRILYTALVASMMISTSVYAQPGKVKDKGNRGYASDSVVKDAAEAIKGDKLSREARTIIRTVFDELFGGDPERAREWEESKHSGKGLPPGLQKQLERRGSLPPGLEKHIRETGTLPPGLESRHVPSEVYERAGDFGKGRELFWVDEDVYLIESATRTIIDVVEDIFSN